MATSQPRQEKVIVIKKMWVFLKSYWYIPLLAILALVARLKNGKLEAIMDAAGESRKRQNDAIDAAALEKEHKKKQIQQEYNDAIHAATKIYALQKKTLNRDKKNKVKKITKQYYNDKEKLAQEISNEFGFQYIPRKDNSGS